MMTRMAALLGGVPLMLGQGTGSEILAVPRLRHGWWPDRQPGADARDLDGSSRFTTGRKLTLEIFSCRQDA